MDLFSTFKRQSEPVVIGNNTPKTSSVTEANKPDIFDEIIEAHRQSLEDKQKISEDIPEDSRKWTWNTSKIRDKYTSVKIPPHVREQLTDIDVFNWFFTAFTNYVSNFNYKYPSSMFFAEYPVPDQLRNKIAADTILFDMEKDGVVWCYL